MPFRWSLNPYRGCVHACHYCYARATHPYLGLNADEDFATKIVVKTNMPEVLRQELGRRSWTRERVAIGTATDAYQPCEGRYRLTRRCLEALRDADTPVSIVTKSTLILRDLDLLTELAHGPGATVYFTITTLLAWRLIEPGTPPPHASRSCGASRAGVLRRLPGADPARHHRCNGIDRRGGCGREGAWCGLVRLACCAWHLWSRSTTSAFVAATFPPAAALRAGLRRDEHLVGLPGGDRAAPRPGSGATRLHRGCDAEPTGSRAHTDADCRDCGGRIGAAGASADVNSASSSVR